MISPTQLVDHPGQCFHENVEARRGHLYFGEQRTIFTNAHAETLRPTNVDSDESGQDSMRAFSSFNVLRMRFSARRLTKPGSGKTSSISRP